MIDPDTKSLSVTDIERLYAWAKAQQLNALALSNEHCALSFERDVKAAIPAASDSNEIQTAPKHLNNLHQTAEGFGRFYPVSTFKEGAFVNADDLLGFVEADLLRRPVRASKTAIITTCSVTAGDDVIYGDPLCEYQEIAK
jgi:biotin carboxyl carrier protein